MAEVTSYDPKRGLGAMDRILLRGAASNKSAIELSALTGGVIKPAAALARVQEILESRTVYTEMQKELLWLDEVNELKDELKRQVLDHKALDHAPTLLNAFKLIQSSILNRKLDIGKAMREIQRAHAQIMLSAISLITERALHILEKNHPEIEWGNEMQEIFGLVIPGAVKEIEAHVVE